jgi:hypothetical protein
VASELDEGFDKDVLIQMLAQLDRIDDDELQDLGGDPDAIRAFARTWAEDLDSHPA